MGESLRFGASRLRAHRGYWRTSRLVVGLIALGLSLWIPAGVLASGAASASAVMTIGSGKTTLTYCHNGGVPETLDLYEPNPVRPVPVVVYLHGGGWSGGGAGLERGSLVSDVEERIVSEGSIFASVEYRLAPRFVWPSQIADASCAVDFLRSDSAVLHIDPRHVGAIGDSAGGQLVALLGLDETTSGPLRSRGVQAVVDLFGPADLESADWASSPLVEAVAPSVFGCRLGPAPAGSDCDRELGSASPVNHVERGAPPFLIVQGSDDTVVPPSQSVELADRLRAARDPVTLLMVHGAQHELGAADQGSVSPSIPSLADQATAFLMANLTRNLK
jgi:acetyl esterase/lipase